MSESKHTPQVRPGPGSPASDDEAIGRLLRLAGPRPRAPQERAVRVKAAVRAHWRQQLRQQLESSRQPVQRIDTRPPFKSRLSARRTGLVLASAASLIIGLGLVLTRLPRAPMPAPVVVASVEAMTGSVEVIPAAGAAHQLTLAEPITTGTRLITGSDGRVALRLGNGSSLRLDHQTRLRMVSTSAVALDRGAVYVDSGAESSGTTLAIETSFGIARDIGTQFEVRIDEETLQVRVREGTVRLERGQGVHEARAGTELLVESDGTMVCRTIPRHGELWQWVLEIAPGFDLEGASLAGFIDWVARETGWQVEPADEQAARAIISSTLTVYGGLAGLSPDQAPAAVLPTCNLESTVSNGVLTIRTMTARGDQLRE
jgi:ferric-dicitrate binding protein FerR (iron transport regulator)